MLGKPTEVLRSAAANGDLRDMCPRINDRERRGIAISGDQAATKGTECEQRGPEFARSGQKILGCCRRKNGHGRLHVRNRGRHRGPPQHLRIARAQPDGGHLANCDQV